MLHINFNRYSVLTVCLLAVLVLSASQADPPTPSPFPSPEPTSPFTFTKIVDTKTEIPGRGDTFTAFGGPFDNGPSISNGVIAFNSQGPDNYQAVFTYSNRKLNMLVDTGTLVPGKNVSFTHFGHPSIDGGTTTFAASYGVDPPSPLAPTDNSTFAVTLCVGP